MKKILLLIILLSLYCTINDFLVFGSNIEHEMKTYCQATLDDEFEGDSILVTIRNDISISNTQYDVKNFVDIGCIKVEDLTYEISNFFINECTEYIKSSLNFEMFHRILKLSLSENDKENVLLSIKELEKRSDILSANPNYIFSEENIITSNYSILSNSLDIYNNEYYELINLNSSVYMGTNTIKVGIIDSGIQKTHNYLIDNLNLAFSRNFTVAESLYTEIAEREVDPNFDLMNHGTMVAGIIGSKFNSTNSIRGIMTNNIELVSLKVNNTSSNSLYSNGTIKSSWIVNAITAATVSNIPILNFSISISYNDTSIKTAMESYGGLIVCAAGNDSANIDLINNFYPTQWNLNNVISVGGVDSSGGIYENSNYGKTSVHLFAPAKDVYSTNNSNDYTFLSGTSFAAPFVTGTAALLMSDCPSLTPSEIIDIIVSSVDISNELQSMCISGGILNVGMAQKKAHFYAVSKNKLSGHSYGKYNNNSNHKFLCSCGIVLYEEHNIEYDGYSNNEHVEICDCGYRSNLSHNYTYLNYSTTKHSVSCDCCYLYYQNHVVKASNESLTIKYCMYCGAKIFDIDFGEIGGLSHFGTNKTSNGSYILPNGIIVLTEADITDFENGTLIFCNNNLYI